jgi:predicted cation transporter
MINTQRKTPIGIFTGVFLIIGLVIHFWPKPTCGVLAESLSSGFFMRWQAPVLLLVQSDKSQMAISADSKELACEKALMEISQRSMPN